MYGNHNNNVDVMFTDSDELDSNMYGNLKMDKFLFLDIDGVLNNTNYHESKSEFPYPLSAFCKENVEAFNKLMNEIPDIKIIISSSWRTDSNLQNIFDKIGLNAKIFGITPFLSDDRSIEIKEYLKDKTNYSYCIIDDINYFDNDEQRDKFVLINERIGFTNSDIDRVKKILEN